MTLEEQLHRVAKLLEATAEIALRNEQAIKKCFELQELQQRNLAALADKHAILTDTVVALAGKHAILADTVVKLAEKHSVLIETVTALGAAVADYVRTGNERMQQMEANLDALIRIITTEHSNGKGKL
jgi:leucyl aminopeptidase (aminopeptidase T)